MRYKRLQEENRSRRRTVVDAIETLREQIRAEDNDRAELRIWCMQLPSRDVVRLVVFFESFPGITLIVSLPTSAFSRGLQPNQSKFQQYDIAELDGASLYGAGTVELKDGTRLRLLEVIPALLPYEISQLDWRIVNHVVSMMGAQDRCYVHPSRSSSPSMRKIARGDFLDCNPDVKDISETHDI